MRSALTRCLRLLHQPADGSVGKAQFLRLEQLGRSQRPGGFAQASLHAHHGGNSRKKPGIDPGQLVNSLDAHALAQRPRNGEYPQWRRVAQRILQVRGLAGIGVETIDPDIEHAQRFLDHFGKAAPEAHHFADALHFAADAHRRALELAEIPARHLAHQVIERGLEERGGATGDAVGQIDQRITDGQLGRHVSQRITGGLARQRAGARQARIHFDDAVVACCADPARTGYCIRRRFPGDEWSASRWSAGSGAPRH